MNPFPVVTRRIFSYGGFDMLSIKVIVENMSQKLGKYLKIRKPEQKVKSLRQVYCYMGYCRRYPESNYSYYKHISHDYSKDLIESAMETACTVGVLKTLTSILDYGEAVKPEIKNAEFKFLQEKLKSDLKLFKGWKQEYISGADDLVKRIKEGTDSWGEE